MNTNLYNYFLKIMFCFLFSLLFINVSLAWYNDYGFRTGEDVKTVYNYDLNNFVYLLNGSYINTQKLVSEGKLKASCSDLRITDSNDQLLYYDFDYYESSTYGCNSQKTLVWVNSYISGSNTTRNYVYYGKSSENTLGNSTLTYSNAGIAAAFHLSTFNGNNGLRNSTCYNTGTPSQVVGVFGYGLNFQGISYLLCGNNNDYVFKDNFTYETWFKTNSLSSLQILLGKSDGGYNSYEIWHQTDGKLSCEIANSTLITQVICNSTNTFSVNEWHYISCVKNSTHLSIYVDGNLENSCQANFLATPYSSTPLQIGGRFNGQYKYNGVLDEVRLYSRVRNAYEIKRDYYYGLSFLNSEETNNILSVPSIITFNPENKTYYKRNYLDKVRFILVSDDNTTIPYDIIVNNGGFEGGIAYNNTLKESYANLTFGSGVGYLHEGNNVIEIYAYNKYGLTPYTCSLGIDCNKTSIIFNVRNYDFINASSETYIYETETYNYSISVRINPDIVTNTNAILWWNGTYNQYTNRIIDNKENYTDIVFTTKLTIPLIQSNNTIVNKFYEIDYFLSNSTIRDEFYDINVNNILYAFYLEPTTNNQIQNATNVIEGDKFINRVYVVNKSSNKNVNIDVKSYYNNVEYQSYYSSKYNQYNSYDSLITANMVNNDYETHNLYSNITITYNGSKRTHTTETDNINVYMIKLKNCDVNDLITLNYTLRNEKYDTPINATLEQSFSVYNGVIIRNYSFSTTDYYKEICIYPKWAKYRIDNINYYYNTVYKPRFYNIKNTEISNSTQTIILYLSEYAEEVLVYVKDNNNNPLSNVIVKALKYYPSLNEYKTITQSVTDDDGKAMLYLDVGMIYYKFIIESDGVVLKTTNPMTITCSAGYSCPPYYINIYVEDKQQSNFDYIKDIAYHCRLNTTSSNLICSVIDTRLFSTDSRLVVYKKGAFDFNKICDITGDTSGSEIICNLGNLTDNIFKYNLYIKLNNEYLLLKNEIIDLKDKPINFGIDGLLLSFIIILTLSFVGIWNAQVSIFLSILGIIAGYTIGFVTISISSLISLILVAIILIIRGNR